MRGCTGVLKKRVAKGEVLLVGCIMDSRSGSAVEMYHSYGYDAVMIDREHTALNSETVLEHIRLCRALEIPAIVRVADASYHELNRTLDQAPDGIMVPRVRTRKDVELVLQTIKYPPVGQRGLGASTGPIGNYVGWPKLEKQIAYVNRQVMVGIQIETAEALADIDNILSVPGIDVGVVGNDDLSIGMGIPGELDNPRYLKAVKTVIAACGRHRVMPGIAGGDPVWVRYWRDKGMRMFWCAADVVSMWEATGKSIAAIRASLAARSSPKSPFTVGHRRVRYSK